MKLSKIASIIVLSACFSLTACSYKPVSLYDELGGMNKIETITDLFIDEISYNPNIVKYFNNTNIERFREKLIEHLCEVSNGPCVYTGDSMEAVHTGMDISEQHFNLTVELLINAMNKADIPHPTQNKLLARLAPMRKEIIYR